MPPATEVSFLRMCPLSRAVPPEPYFQSLYTALTRDFTQRPHPFSARGLLSPSGSYCLLLYSPLLLKDSIEGYLKALNSDHTLGKEGCPCI